MQDPIAATIPTSVEQPSSPGVTRGRSQAPNLWEQVVGVFTAPIELSKRLAKTPRWGHAQWLIIVVAWLMITVWSLKVDVDAFQRPILEQNSQLSAKQIEQTIAVSERFILPMSDFSAALRSLLSNLGLALIFWLYAMSTSQPKKPNYLHALSAVTVANLVLIPYTLLIGAVCFLKGVGSQIPERLAPSGLGYYLQPENPKLYGLVAQIDPFIIGYFLMLYVGARYTMRLERGDAIACTALGVLIFLAWKVYFWV